MFWEIVADSFDKIFFGKKRTKKTRLEFTELLTIILRYYL